ncbi:nitrous oxide reductase accessory protein NosL [Natrinema sp. 1APR25-10V2]|uniref:nitrous oxide reductase accessory protein NosL n=1 Tax=Natrinema sp. 1APR25-10V2 TaxID=2951081 RepID=UPI0028758FAB|nr:nitrous oxide reductase accessory protein NosL [Natrinema sp. 1APR25-10V2]MDS0478385.1 nitrous oxide reductase accessory protein NosL [Natrinema sp. 1APR25-10V2]
MEPPTSVARIDGPVMRRTVLGGIAAAGLGSVAGCFSNQGTANAPDPVSIDPEHACDNCTMMVGRHPGPAGQSHYEDPTAVLDEDRPAQFCSTLCAYAFTFDHQSENEPAVSYRTDYSAVEYEVNDSGQRPVISRHLEADAFADVSDLTMVAGSEIEGAMGSSMIPFGDADQADEFQAEYGGDNYTHDEVTRELVMSLMN